MMSVLLAYRFAFARHFAKKTAASTAVLARMEGRVAMRWGFACLVLCLFCAPASAEDQAPLPDFFQKSWDAAAAKPLQLMSLTPTAPTRAIVPLAAPVRASLQPVDDLPPVMLDGIPKPPARPNLPGNTAAFAAPDEGAAPKFVPQPVPRPGGIDQRMTSEPVLQPEEKPNVLLAMLNPGAGMAINALARMQPMPAITNGACSVSQPFKVTALGPNGRAVLSPAATLDSSMITGLARWEALVQAAAKRDLGESIAAMHVAASYDCRTMNHRRRAHLSEHAHANAIDVSGYITASGKDITVKRDFHGGGAKEAFLKDVHAATCEVFQVVLGPGSDGFHEDHFHMDMGHWKACR